MPWCPKCKNEFVEGISECKKCHCKLVDRLIEPEEIIAKGEPSQLQNIAEILKNNGIKTPRVQFDEGMEQNVLLVDKEEREASLKVLEDLVRVQNEKRYQQMRSVRPGRNLGTNEMYQNKMEQAQEVKSSAYSLIIVGTAGLILDVLCVFDVLPVHWSLFTKTITCSVMGVLFICLVVMGFLSVKSFKSLLSFAKEEDKMTGEIEKWYQKELTAERIDKMLEGQMDTAASDEEKYFHRVEMINHVLTEKFMNLDPAYAENMTEKIYQEIFDHED